VRKKIILLSASLCGIFGFSQTKKLTMEEAVIGLGTNLRIESLSQLQWIPNQNSFTESVKTAYGSALVVRQVPEMKTDTLVRSKDFSEFNLKSVPVLNWIDEDQAWFKQGTDYILWNKFTKK